MTLALLGVCVPGVWLSLNFIYLFSVRLGWLPVAGYASVFQDPVAATRYMLLPAVSLGFNQSALIARIARSCMIEVLRQDYIRTARAKGLAERSVIFLHAFPASAASSSRRSCAGIIRSCRASCCSRPPRTC